MVLCKNCLQVKLDVIPCNIKGIAGRKSPYLYQCTPVPISLGLSTTKQLPKAKNWDSESSEGSAEARDDPFSLFFWTSFRLENLLAYQECNTQHLGVSREIKLWILTVNSVLAPARRIHICEVFLQEIPYFSLPYRNQVTQAVSFPWKQWINFG